jgi:hypothetical protein
MIVLLSLAPWTCCTSPWSLRVSSNFRVSLKFTLSRWQLRSPLISNRNYTEQIQDSPNCKKWKDRWWCSRYSQNQILKWNGLNTHRPSHILNYHILRVSSNFRVSLKFTLSRWQLRSPLISNSSGMTTRRSRNSDHSSKNVVFFNLFVRDGGGG